VGVLTPAQSYLNGRLTLFISIEEERQLLRGTGTNELIGLFNRTGGQAINLYTRLAADDNTTALARVIANTRGSSFLQPDAVIMHPTNWLNSRLVRGRDGRHGRPVLRRRPVHRGVRQRGRRKAVRRVALEHAGRVEHGRRHGDGVGRLLRPGSPHLAARRRVRRSDKFALGPVLRRTEPADMN
jgi:hypothetical protein